MCEVPMEGITVALMIARASAGAPEADGDVGGAVVAVVGRHVGALARWGTEE